MTPISRRGILERGAQARDGRGVRRSVCKRATDPRVTIGLIGARGWGAAICVSSPRDATSTWPTFATSTSARLAEAVSVVEKASGKAPKR